MDANPLTQQLSESTSSNDEIYFTIRTYGGAHSVQARQYKSLLEAVDTLREKIGDSKYNNVKLCLHLNGEIVVLHNEASQPENTPAKP